MPSFHDEKKLVLVPPLREKGIQARLFDLMNVFKFYYSRVLLLNFCMHLCDTVFFALSVSCQILMEACSVYLRHLLIFEVKLVLELSVHAVEGNRKALD
jgi:hypothetical protein